MLLYCPLVAGVSIFGLISQWNRNISHKPIPKTNNYLINYRGIPENVTILLFLPVTTVFVVSSFQTPSALTRNSLLSDIYLLCFIYTFIYWQFYVFHCTGYCRVSYQPIRRLCCCGHRSSRGQPQGSSAFLNGVFTVPYYITVLYIIMNESGVSQISHFIILFISFYIFFATFFNLILYF